MTDKFDLLKKRVKVASIDRQVYMTVPTVEVLELLEEIEILHHKIDAGLARSLRAELRLRDSNQSITIFTAPE
jgi:hypothetical protein